jgi:hypothetical protein
MSLMNPGRQPVCNFYLNLPGISDVNLNIGNNSLTWDDVILESPVNDSLLPILHPDVPDSDLDEFLNTLKTKNSIFTQFSTNILGFGFRAGDSYLSFHVREKSGFRFSYPKDLMRLITRGNLKGQNTNFTHFNLFTNHYLEYSFGYSGKIHQDLSFGVRVKYLNGLANFQTRESNLKFYTSSYKNANLADSVSLTSDIEIQGTGPVDVSTDSIGLVEEIEPFDPEVDDLFKNPGFAIDFGVNFKLRDDLELSASVNDLGFINYKNYSHRYTINGQFSFTGVDITSKLENEGLETDIGEKMLDSLENAIQFSYVEEGFFHFLGPKVFIGGSYEVSDRVDFGLLSRTTFFGGNLNQSITLSANTRPIPGVSFSASYSVMNGAFNNLGAGLGLRLGPLQLFAVSDVASAGLWLGETKAINLRAGLNFVFGCNRKKRILDDEPMIR